MKEDKRKRKFKKVYKNNKIYVKVAREMIYFFVGIGYLIKETLIETFKDIVRLITGLIYLLIQLLKGINTLVVKLFNKLPKLAKIAVIYCLIALSLNGLFNEKVIYIETNAEEQEETFEFKMEIPAQNEELKTYVDEQITLKNKVCENKIACDIYETSLNKGLSTEQAILLVSISKHETGHWSSNAFINKNNFGGICNSSGIKYYSSYEEGLNAFIDLLINRYFNRGLNTIEQIGNVYCPVGASNDPNGLNQHWIPKVSQYYNNYLGK
jgi:hypothetical protein